MAAVIWSRIVEAFAKQKRKRYGADNIYLDNGTPVSMSGMTLTWKVVKP